MTGLIMAAQLILGLSILVVLHELGHFLAARAFGIKVEKFYLFFDAWGVKLFSFKKGDTEYGIGWLPLGGYVKISGMVDESMDKEAMKQPPQPWEFRSKPAWQRLIVMVAGVTMNAILGVAIFSFSLFHYAKKYLPNEEIKEGIYAYELARYVGLETGDKVIAINGKSFERFEDLLSTRVMFGATLTVDRNGRKVDVQIPDSLYRTITRAGRGKFIGPDNVAVVVDSVPKGTNADKAGLRAGDKIIAINGMPASFGQLREENIKNINNKVELTINRDDQTIILPVQVDSNGILGFSHHNPYKGKDYTLGKAICFGASDANEALVGTVKGLGKVFSGQEKASESIQGPIGIARIYGGIWDWARFWSITGLLSMVLAFMNILPIPALDGGHVIFLIIEAVTRKKFSDSFMEKAQIVGMVLLLCLMVFAFGNDIRKLF
jgi:regulator of sigma E protease